MKKLLLIAAAALVAVFAVKKCGDTDSDGNVVTSDGTPINGYQSTVVGVEGNVVELSSGVRVRLIGVAPDRKDVEKYLNKTLMNKDVELYADSSDPVQVIETNEDTVRAYMIVPAESQWSVNHLAVDQYNDAYMSEEVPDSTESGAKPWVSYEPKIIPNLALYMKDRSFQVQNADGSLGSGFFISRDGLAVTNNHVLTPAQAGNAAIIMYSDDPDESTLDPNRVYPIKSIVGTSDADTGYDLTIFYVNLGGDQVKNFRVAKQRPVVGDELATFGNPLGAAATFTSGKLSAFRHDERGFDLMQYDMSTNGGNSGGPVCNKYGEIVGVHELGNKSAQGFNFGIDLNALRDMLKQCNVPYEGK